MGFLDGLQKSRWAKAQSKYSSLPGPRSESDRDSEDSLIEQKHQYHRRLQEQRPAWRRPWFWIAHLAIFSLYLVVLFTALDSSSRGGFGSRGHLSQTYLNSLPDSPGVEALEWQHINFRAEDRIQEFGKYAGKPSPQLDRAWHDLLNAENIMVEEEYMRALGRENLGVRIPDGSGYIGTLNVYHEIHCLKRIHQFMYPDYYFPDFTPEQHEINRVHNEHCIDFILQSSMCHGDVGLMTFEWVDGNLIPLANSTSHQCISWEKLDKWTKKRTVNMMKPGWLIHPTMGPAYPKGQGDKLGAAVLNKEPHLSHGH